MFNFPLLSNNFNNEIFKSVPLRIANASDTEKMASYALCCAMLVAVPVYAYKKFVAREVKKPPQIIIISKIASFANEELTLKKIKISRSYSETTLSTRSILVPSPFLIRKKKIKKNRVKSQEKIISKEKKIFKACKSLSKHCKMFVDYLVNPLVQEKGKDLSKYLLFYVHKVNMTIRELEIDKLIKIQLFLNAEEILDGHPTSPCSLKKLERMSFPDLKWKEELADEIEIQNLEIICILRKSLTNIIS